MSLRLRALILVAVTLLPAILILIFNEVSLRSAREAEIRVQAAAAADAAGRDIARQFEGVRNLLVALSLMPDVLSANEPECNAFFVRLTQSDANFLNIATADTTGEIRCTAVPKRNPMINARGRPYFRAVETNDFTVGEFTIGQSINQHVLQLAYPLRSEVGQAAGVVWVALKLGALQDYLSRIRLAESATLTVADRNGTILAQAPDRGGIGAALPAELRPLMAGKASGWHEAAIDGTGKTHVYGYVPLDGPPQDIFVLYGIEKDAALAPIADATMRGLLLIVLGIALSGVLALWMTERFIERPVAGLIATIERWLAGSYAERATIPGRHTEIGRLAAAFNNLAETVSIRERALQRSEGELRAIFEFAGRGKVLTDPATGRFLRVNRAFCEMLGYTPEELLERTVADVTHPEHHEEDAAAFARLARGEMAAFDREKRYVTKTGEVIWVRANLVVLRDAAGGAVYAVSVIEDITARRAEAERMKLLSAEVDHRAKNMLATVLAITRMTRADSAKAMTDTLAGRFQTLARAHTLLSESHWKGADLKRLLSDELSAYVQAGRVAISGPTIALQPQMAQSLAMTAHELATNAAKYGALSSPAGRVTIAWTWEGKNRFALEWQEARGPAVQAPERQGFGTSLISTMVERQLGGSVVFDWRPEGLACRMVIPMDERG